MSRPHSSSPLLFSIDLEEFYPAAAGSESQSSPLPALTERYLGLLKRHNVRSTFFVVGDVARRFPNLLRKIAAEGHEIGCHGDRHVTLDRFTPETLVDDLRANRAAIEAATGLRAAGFRAPLLSLTKQTSWAHAVLAKEGFTYSSSVLPACNPLYGWPDFGITPRFADGVLEIPATVIRLPGLGALPLFCGTYFRVLPSWLTCAKLASVPDKLPLVSYFHPYDIDHRQPWTMHAGVRGNRLMNLLLFFRRTSLPARIERLLKACPKRSTYCDYVANTHFPI